MIEAVTRFYERDTANIHRGVHTLAERADRDLRAGRARRSAASSAWRRRGGLHPRHHRGDQPGRAQLLAAPAPRAGRRVLVTWLEHHANIVPWQIVCDEAGAIVEPVPIDDRRRHRPRRPRGGAARRATAGGRSGWWRSATSRTPSAPSTRCAEIVEMAHAPEVPVLVDGAQAVPHAALDLGDADGAGGLGCDFFAFSGHKAYGPSGIGAPVGPPEHLAAMPPMLGGGNMIRSVSFDGTSYADPPARFEAGTANIEGVAGLAAALDFLERARPGGGRTPTRRSWWPTRPRSCPPSRGSPSSAPRRTRRRSSPSRWTACTPTTWARSSTARASPSAPATTARSR